jgi:hypothetical protein
MKIFLKSAFFFALMLGLSGTLFAYAEESQFSLFIEEFNIPIAGNHTSDMPERLENVPYGELPEAFKNCFDRTGGVRLNFKETNERGQPLMTLEELEKLTFTGPYYLFYQHDRTDTTDLADFRQTFNNAPSLIYLVRMGTHPAGTFVVSYDKGIYVYQELGEFGNGEFVISLLNYLSSSRGLADDAFFLQIRSERFIVNKDGMVFSRWMTKAEPLSNLVKASYLAQREIDEVENNGVIDDAVGGGSVSAYIHNLNHFFEISNAEISERNSAWIWLVAGGLCLTAIVVGLLVYKHKQKAKMIK